jgi:hypothetical protein
VPIHYTGVDGTSTCYGLLAVDAPNKDPKNLFLDKKQIVRKECLTILCYAADLLATHALILRIQKSSGEKTVETL